MGSAPSEPARSDRHSSFGWFLTACGVVGLLAGAVVLVFGLFRIIAGRSAASATDIMEHGIEGMQLAPEWAALSSAMGAYLGVLLIAAGTGWRRGRPWAPLVTWGYVSCGLVVNLTDMVIFAVAAAPGPMRSLMLVLDGLALLLVLFVGVWLLRRAAVNRRGR